MQLWRVVVCAAVLAVVAVAVTAPALCASQRAVQRPLSDFLDAQAPLGGWGATCCPAVGGWTGDEPGTHPRPRTTWGGIDCTGVVERAFRTMSPDLSFPDLGTTLEGTVTERPLDTDHAEVTVVLHTRNALAWAWTVPDAQALFGSDPSSVVSGGEPALGESLLHVVFVNDGGLGAPLPCLTQAYCLGQITYLGLQARATGPLHAAFGVAEGTGGRMTIQQLAAHGLAGVPGKGLDEYGWPVETVSLQAVGPAP